MAEIQLEKTALGLELGSTRIKAVLIGPEHAVLASGAHDWENRLEHGYWTYALDDVWAGVQDAFARLARQVQERYGTPLHTVGAMGVSGMMHGYLPFARDGAQLAAFRTWRNTTTERAAALLTEPVCVQRSTTVERCASVPGYIGRRAPCAGHCILDHAGGLCALAADGGKGAGRGRSVGHVPH